MLPVVIHRLRARRTRPGPERQSRVIEPDNLVASVAGTQDGVVSRGQVLLLGLTDEWIEARLRSGRWQRVFAGTYATFSGPVPFAARVSAALLRAGLGATARGRTAAALYGLVPPDLARPIEVLVPRSRRVTAEAVIRVRYSQEVDVRRNPLWSPSRVRVEDAVLDLAQECRSLTDVADWVSRASARSLTTPERVRAALRDRARHRWRRELMAMLADIEVGAHSPLEIRYLNRVERAHGLPAAHVSIPLSGELCGSSTWSTKSSRRGSSWTAGSGMRAMGPSGTAVVTTRACGPVAPHCAMAGARSSTPLARSPARWPECSGPEAGPAGRGAADRRATSQGPRRGRRGRTAGKDRPCPDPEDPSRCRQLTWA